MSERAIRRRWWRGAGTAALVVALLATSANAGAFHGTRSKWTVGAGWNFGRGTFEDPEGNRDSYREGSSSQIRAGRMIGDHFMIGVDYQGWAIEFGGPPVPGHADVLTKQRGSLQNLSASLTLFPGRPGTALGGWYVRAGAGLGWSGKGEKEVPLGEGEEVHGGHRVDQFGVGVLAETGYEIWLYRAFSIAPGVSFNYLQIGGKDETVTVRGDDVTVRGVERAGFAAAQITFNVYWGGDS